MRSFRCLSLRLITVCALAAIPALAQSDVVFIAEENKSGTRLDSMLVWETPLANLSPITASNALGPVFMFPARKPVARLLPGTNTIRVFVADGFNINILEYTPNGAGTGQFVVLSRFGPPSGNPGNVAVNSTLDRLYVGTGAGGYFSTILEYDIGALTSGATGQSVGAPLRSFTLPLTALIMTINPQGTRILAMDGGGQPDVADVDLTTGVASIISTGADYTLGTIKIEPSQGCYGYFPVRQNDSQGNPDPSTRKIGVIDLCSSNPGTYSTISITGATSSSGNSIGQLQPADLDFDPIGDRAYFSTWPAGVYTSSYVLVLDNVSTGGSNPHLSSTGSLYTGYSLSVSPITRRLYLTYAFNGVYFSAFELDPATGDLQLSNAITTGFPTDPTTPIAGVATIPITTIKAKAVVTNDLADLTPLVSINTTANTVIENIAIGATANLSTTSPQGSGLTTDPRYIFNGWIKDPAKCGDPSTNANLAITSDPASFPGPDTYCACFEKQFYVNVTLGRGCTLNLNGKAAASGWYPAGNTTVQAGPVAQGGFLPLPRFTFTDFGGTLPGNSPNTSFDLTGPKEITVNCRDNANPNPGGGFNQPCITAPKLGSLITWYTFDNAPAAPTDIGIAPRPAVAVAGNPSADPNPRVGAGAMRFSFFNYLRAPSNEGDINTTDFSIDVWIKASNVSGTHTFLDKRINSGVPATRGYSFYLLNGYLSFQMADGSNNTATLCNSASTSSNPASCTNWTSIVPQGKVDDGNWHLVAVTVRRNSTTGGTLWVDGSPVLTFDPTIRSGSLSNSSQLFIGSHVIPPGFTGSLDELEIFTAALDEAEIQAIYSAGGGGKCRPACAKLPANAVGWYSFEETSGSLSHDSEGQDNYLAGNPPVRGAGIVGQSLSLGTIADQQQTTGQASELNFGTGDFTIDFWMKYEPFPLAGSPPVRAILEKRTLRPSLGYAVSLDQQGRIRFTMAGGGATSHWIGSTSVTTNNWVFVSIVVRRNQTNPAIYIDGSSTADVLSQTAAMITTNIDSAAPLVVGNNIDIPQSSPSYPVRGLLDELELFNTAVPVAELSAIYGAGANGKCDKKQPGCVPPPAGMVAWYKLDETGAGGAITHADIAGANDVLNRSGGVIPVPAIVAGGQNFVNGGFAFTPSPSPELDFGIGDFSADAWISPQTGWLAGLIVSKYNPATARGWYVAIQPGSGTGPNLELQLAVLSGGATYQWVTQNANIPTGNFTHIAVVAQRNAPPVFYINGVPFAGIIVTQSGGSSTVPAVNVDAPVSLRLGGALPGSLAYQGILDEVELFNRALTAAEVNGIFTARDKGKCVPPPPCDGLACTPRVRLDVQYQAIPAPPPNTLTAKIATFNQILNYSTLVPSGAQVPLDVDTPQQTAPGERYAFVNWSDGGAKQHSTTPLTAATNLFVVTFKKQLLLTVNASDPNCTGFITTTPSSPDGYFDFNTTVTISATGNGSTCLPSSTQPTVATMTTPQTVTVNFTGATSGTTTIDTNPSNLQVLIDGQNAITPRSVTWTPNSTHTLFAITPQTQAGRRYRFAAWSGPNVANPQQNPLLVTAAAGALTYRAAFNAECQLTVNVTGQGTVASEPSSTDGFYPCGSTVTLRASAASGWTFQSYSGAATGTNTTATVLLDDSKTVTATFTQPQGVTHTFATNPANLQLTVDGTSVNTPTSASWIPGSSHTLQAPTPQTAGQKRHSFNGWSGPGISGTQNPVTVTAPQTAAAYTANFVSDCRLTVTTTGQGTVTASPASTDGYYRCGSTVTLTAAPAAGWTFQGYGGAVSGTNVTTTVALDDGKTVTATFVQPQSTAITVATSPAGLNVTVDGTTAAAPRQLSWTPGSSHTLTAPTPQTATGKRYTFTSWTGPQLNSTSPTATVTAPSAPAAYTANFGSECLLTINVTGQGTVSTNPSSPSGFYPCGSSVLLTATPNSGWTFQGYAGAASGSSASVEVLMNDAKTVTATFVQQQAPPPAITIALAGISRTGDGIASRTVLLFNITNTGGSTASNINTTIGMTSTVSLQFTPTAATIAALAAGATSPLTVNINGSLAAGTPINVLFLGNLTTPGGQQQPINQLLRLTMP